MSDRRSILIAGGGTAGHVFPALAVARAFQELAPEYEPVFIGTQDRLEGRLVPEAGFRMHHIDAVSLPRRPSTALLRLPMAMRRTVKECERIIKEERAVAAVTFGGYVSFPLDWAAGRTQLPLVIHEQNAIPGVANKVASRWADRIAVTFPGSADRFPEPERVVVTGNPVRDEILNLDVDAARARAIEKYRLAPGMRTVLIFGGSQGARAVNKAAVETYTLWDDPGSMQILHGAGVKLHEEAAQDWERARSAGSGPMVRCVDFIDDMAAAYAVADVVVCRAGATSISEITALGRPSLLVPYPHATADHQMHNGMALQQAGGATVVADKDISGATIVEAVQPWLTDPDEHARVTRASLAFGRREAATLVANQVLSLVGV